MVHGANVVSLIQSRLFVFTTPAPVDAARREITSYLILFTENPRYRCFTILHER